MWALREECDAFAIDGIWREVRVARVRILGLVFAGTATVNRAEMVEFLATTLGFEPVTDAASEADMFELPDGSRFAVAGVADLGDEYRTVGFLVSELDEAVAELRSVGIVVDEPAETERHRYVHLEAPDGHVYELVEERLNLPRTKSRRPTDLRRALSE
jgi:hypothetical protein